MACCGTVFRILSRLLGSAAWEVPTVARKGLSKAPQTPTFTVCVEGNIGSGKSTLLEHFADCPEVEVTREDVDGWCDVQGHNLLHMAYTDPTRWSHLLQTHVQLTLMKGHAKGVSAGCKVKLMERSIHSARYCFLENLYLNGMISQPEYLVTHGWYERLVALTDCRADLVLYLRTDPETCHNRVLRRGRLEEVGLSLYLLQNLHQRHEEWLVGGRFPSYGRLVVLDANLELSAIVKECHKVLEAHLGTHT